jgi:hypothetical protein
LGTVLLLPSTVAGCASTTSCAFNYDQQVIDALVVPALQKNYGVNYTMFDLKKPGISRNRRSMELIFRLSRPDVLDAPFFIIEIDPCRKMVVDAYETSPFPKLPKR